MKDATPYRHLLEGTVANTETLNQGSRSPGKDMISESAKYEVGLLFVCQ